MLKRIVLRGGIEGFNANTMREINPRQIGLDPKAPSPSIVTVVIQTLAQPVEVVGLKLPAMVAAVPCISEYRLRYVRACKCEESHEVEFYDFAELLDSDDDEEGKSDASEH